MVRSATLTTEPSRIATPEPRVTPASIIRPRVDSRATNAGAAVLIWCPT